MVEIEINSDCNRACRYCPNSRYKRKELGEMQPELFKLILKQLKSIKFKGRLSFHFYGEPLCCSILDYFISLTRHELPQSRLVLYSNGDHINEKRIRTLIAAGIDRFIITQQEGPIHEFKKLYSIMPEFIVSKIEYLHYTDLKLTNRGGLMPEIGDPAPGEVPCYVPSSSVVITLLGNVLPCFEDYNQRYIMGNLQDMHIMDIWNTSEYLNFRQQLSLGQRNCFEICSLCNNTSVKGIEQFDFVL